jgi:hypothetical protein
MDAARASGMVPGMRFATVNPTPPSMKLRREIFDLVRVSSLRYFLLMCAMGAASDHGSGLRHLLEKFSLSADRRTYRRLAGCDPQYGSPAPDNRSRGRGDHKK